MKKERKKRAERQKSDAPWDKARKAALPAGTAVTPKIKA